MSRLASRDAHSTNSPTFATTKLRAGTFEPVAEDPAAQVAFASAEANLRSARAFVLDEASALWDTARAGDPPR